MQRIGLEQQEQEERHTRNRQPPREMETAAEKAYAGKCCIDEQRAKRHVGIGKLTCQCTAPCTHAIAVVGDDERIDEIFLHEGGEVAGHGKPNGHGHTHHGHAQKSHEHCVCPFVGKRLHDHNECHAAHHEEHVPFHQQTPCHAHSHPEGGTAKVHARCRLQHQTSVKDADRYPWQAEVFGLRLTVYRSQQYEHRHDDYRHK